MKLLFCKECTAVFSLSYKEKSCDCGKTKGRYRDQMNVVYQGPAMPIGFNNSSFMSTVAIQSLLELKEKDNPDVCCKGEEFTAFTIPAWAKSITKIKEKEAKYT
tara:strand:- start:280 stop:591 length:312 start_codon:yes stop_codon:yes gene_type:complete